MDVGRGEGGEAMSIGVVGTDLDGFRMSWKVLFLDTPYLVDWSGMTICILHYLGNI